MKSFFTSLIVLVALSASAQQDDERIYSEWLEGLYPKSYENVNNMVKRIWGNNDPSKIGILVEVHCEAVSKLMDIRRSKDVDEKIFSAVLDKWSLSNDEERMANWYEWPHTNWVKVLQEYNKRIAEQEGGN